ncbi:MAG: nucleotidyltransferase substrate binding protein [Segetibacter sp.]|nr:nucleotidyltransferase substrate binding protein [Segetibacter sp.]
MEIDLTKYNEFETDIIKNGQIQKFEYTLELLWKTLKKYFEVKRENIILYLKDAIKGFFAEGALDEKTYLGLMNAIKSRNLLSNIYKIEMFDLIYPQLKSYTKAIRHACTALGPHTL